MRRLKIVVDSLSVWGPVFSTRNHVAPSDREQRDWKSSMSRELRDFFLGHFQNEIESVLIPFRPSRPNSNGWYLSFLLSALLRLTVLSIKKNLIGQFLVCGWIDKNFWYWNSYVIKFDFSECTVNWFGSKRAKKHNNNLWYKKYHYTYQYFWESQSVAIIPLHIIVWNLPIVEGGERCSTFENIKQGMQSLEFRSWLLPTHYCYYSCIFFEQVIYFIFNVLYYYRLKLRNLVVDYSFLTCPQIFFEVLLSHSKQHTAKRRGSTC